MCRQLLSLVKYSGLLLLVFSLPFPATGQPARRKTVPRQSVLTEKKSEENSIQPRLVVQTGHTADADSVAFSRDGRLIATGSWMDHTAIVWEADSGREIRRFNGNTEGGDTRTGKSFVAFSPDNMQLAVACEQSIRVWDVVTGKLLQRFHCEGAGRNTRAIFFAADNSTLTVKLLDEGLDDLTARKIIPELLTFDCQTGRLLRRKRSAPEMTQPGVISALSSDGRVRAWASEREQGGKVVRVLDNQTGKPLSSLKGFDGLITSLSLSPDGRLAVTAAYSEPTRLWETTTGQELRQLTGKAAQEFACGFTDTSLLAIAVHEGAVRLRDVLTGQISVLSLPRPELRKGLMVAPELGLAAACLDDFAGIFRLADQSLVARLYGTAQEFERMVFSADGRFLITVDQDGRPHLFNAADGRRIPLLTGDVSEAARVYSADGRLAVECDYDERTGRQGIALLDGETGKPFRKLKLTVTENLLPALAISPDKRFFASASSNTRNAQIVFVRLWDRVSGREIRQFNGHKLQVNAIAFSPDGKWLLTGSSDATVLIHEVATGREIVRLRGHEGPVSAAEFSPDGRFVLTMSWDQTTRLWNVATGKELCRLVSYADGDQVAVAPDGRFDTNNLDEVAGLHWIMPDDPLRPLPLEIFMRQYYEPRLAARLLAREQLPPVRRIAELNRLQPEVQITDIQPSGSNTVNVTVAVASVTGPGSQDDQEVRQESGVEDLRLFRDGQLIRYSPAADGRVPLTDGRTTVTFSNIRVPRRADLRQIEFSAYAFNSDRVKSRTARRTYHVPQPVTTHKGRAWIIAAGVNAYENPSFDLRYAASDALSLQQALAKQLRASGEYSEVIPLTLLSEAELRNGQRAITTVTATKANLRFVLERLAGRQGEAETLPRLPEAAAIRRAEPEDTLIIAFAGHGYADAAGRFYLVPYDSGTGTLSEVLRQSISSDELSLWLRDIDAGEIVMIVDACQSAAAVQGGGFKPGPMGSRGLGQLAYDKGLRILTATQADNVALENKTIRHGLLTYALLQDGLASRRADFNPIDKVISLSEWLAYGVARVPQLYAEIRNGSLRDAPSEGAQPHLVIFTPASGKARILVQGEPVDKSGKQKMAGDQVQQPSLFDFSRRRPEIVLWRQ